MEIWNNGENLLILALEYVVDRYATCNLKVESSNYAGQSTFVLWEEEIRKCLCDRSRFYLKDSDSDAYISIIEKDNKLYVQGQVGGTHQPNQLLFSFEVDQSILERISNCLKK